MCLHGRRLRRQASDDLDLESEAEARAQFLRAVESIIEVCSCKKCAL